MAAILTSQHPSRLGLVEKKVRGKTFKWREKRTQLSTVIPLSKPTVTQILSNHGFSTAAFVNQPILSNKNGYHRGFGDFYYPLKSGELHRLDKKGSNIRQAWGSVENSFKNDKRLIVGFDKWLKRHAKEKMFVWFHLLTPHRPYNPHAKYVEDIPVERRKSQPDLYDAEIRAADEMVGRIVKLIEKHAGLERSLIILTSDHGEEFGEHKQHEHGHSLHCEVTHIPLIMASPGFNTGTVVKRYAESIDIAPTILDAVGVKPPPQMKLAGTSLLPYTKDNKFKLEKPFIYAEGMLYGPTEQSIIMGNHKLIFDWQTRQARIYDLSRDPRETTDIAGEHKKTAVKLRKNLMKIYAGFIKEYHSKTKRSSPKKSQRDKARDLKALESLGYL